MRYDAALVAAVGMALALVAMLACLLWPSARTIGVFLGAGLPIAVVSVATFALYVMRDLRARRVL